MKEHMLAETSVELAQVRELAKESLDMLSSLAQPEEHKANYPATFQAVWKWLRMYVHKERDFSKLALGLPRGFGKTTVMKLFLLYVILYTDRRFILIMAETAGKAENILADVMDMLKSYNIVSAYGDYSLGLEKDTASIKKFGFRGRDIIIAAIGESGSVRGLNIKNARPDVMLFDDIQSREDADSESVSEKIYTKLMGTTLKSKAPSGCLYLFVANMYPTKHSILKRLKTNPSWIKFIVGGILANGESLWEEVQPLSQLLEEYQGDLNAGKPEIFHSEVLNDENASVNTAIDISKIPRVIDESGEVSAGSFIIIDPSNDKANSDLVSIGCFHIYGGIPVMTELKDERLSPGDIIRESLRMAARNNCYLIVCEANAFQYSLLYWFNVIATQLGITGISFEPIYSGTKSKNSRILEMFKQLVASPPELMIGDAVWSITISYIAGFNPLRTDNTDNVLDLLCYAPRVMAEMQHLIVLGGELGDDTDVISEEEAALELDDYLGISNEAFDY